MSNDHKKAKTCQENPQILVIVLKYNCDAFKLRETPKVNWYQTNYESSWWRRFELRYGNNPKNDVYLTLKWAIRSQNPKSDNDKDTGKVQRLYGSGSEVIDHHL